MIPTLIVLAVLLGLPLLYFVVTYNSLVALRNHIRDAWANIDTELKRRYDLIPNLVETVKGYAAHEKETLERVIQARNAAVGAEGVQQQAEAENMLTGALRQLFALSENYPNLKANENFLRLQEELTGTENRIAFARQHYNSSVTIYNTATEMFPSSMVAGMFGFRKRDFFEIEDPAEREAPQVQF